jgi:hypothetical protein
MLASLYRCPSFRSDEGAVLPLYKRHGFFIQLPQRPCARDDWVVRTRRRRSRIKRLRVPLISDRLCGDFLWGEAPFWDFWRGYFFLMRLSIWARVVSFMARTPSARTRFKQACDGGVVQDEPVVFGGDIDVAEADLLGRELELGSAVGSFALLDQALLVQKEETPANHYGALCELFRDVRRGVHGARF